MRHRGISTVFVAVLLTGLVTTVVTAVPSTIDEECNGLTKNETATLWSRDVDGSSSQNQDSTNSPLSEVARGTDLSYSKPPETAATWSENDFNDLQSGESDVSVHPAGAATKNGTYIKDAHTSLFAIHPSTRGHLEPNEHPLFVAPSGTIRGLVDYRVEVPETRTWGDTTIRWSLVGSRIEAIRLLKDGETVTEIDGTHKPIISYDFSDEWSATLTLEADIRTHLRRLAIDRSGRTPSYHYSNRRETVSVSQSVDVSIYDFNAYPHYVSYPDGDAGLVISQPRPWRGIVLSDSGPEVRGVWRFFTARDTDWDQLVRSTESGSETVESDAIPVYVHAYPSSIGPRVDPVTTSTSIVDTWGRARESPLGSLDENINVEVVERPYSETRSIALRTDSLVREELRVTGLVRGEYATIGTGGSESERELRRSNLTAEIVERNSSSATIEIGLRDETTGDPIGLADETRYSALRGDSRDGYINVGGKRVRTNSSGKALVTVDSPGIYTISYQPGTWLSHDPAYTSDTTSVRWHPLETLNGILSVIVEAVWRILPYAVVYYAGIQITRTFGFDRYS
ncbi:hypothetical protein SAMN05216564_1165 [Halopenitus persicus]|uniref:Uncharacterized protein n=1 Tax=Halopenitus persicus TaxID=1048396 RepID=A0A1H3NXV0_9EURY|nr:hypothetical protein SAMN05216564_1165 [Halopenitus persicus]